MPKVEMTLSESLKRNDHLVECAVKTAEIFEGLVLPGDKYIILGRKVDVQEANQIAGQLLWIRNKLDEKKEQQVDEEAFFMIIENVDEIVEATREGDADDIRRTAGLEKTEVLKTQNGLLTRVASFLRRRS